METLIDTIQFPHIGHAIDGHPHISFFVLFTLLLFLMKNLQVEVRLSEEKNLLHHHKLQISQDLKRFLQPVREKLLQFEQELKDR